MLVRYAATVLLILAAGAAIAQAGHDPDWRWGWLCVACLIGALWLVPMLALIAHPRM